MSGASEQLARLVRQRANDRCEYCLMHQALQVATFHIEHVVPIAAGGSEDYDNLALACPSCNLRKSDRVVATDAASQAVVPLFSPRAYSWDDHFAWSGYEVTGKTEIGRASIDVLQLNHS